MKPLNNKEKEAIVKHAKDLAKPLEDLSFETLNKVETMFNKVKQDSLSSVIRNKKEADDFMRQLNSLTKDPNKDFSGGCPCLYLDEPCDPRCTCINHFSSVGCHNCCSYGSKEQKRQKAIQIVSRMKGD